MINFQLKFNARQNAPEIAKDSPRLSSSFVTASFRDCLTALSPVFPYVMIHSRIKHPLSIAACLLAFALSPLTLRASDPPASQPQSNAEIAKRVVSAAKGFLDTLDETQRGKVLFDFNDDQQRARWSNLPTGIFERRGLRLGQMNPAQRQAVMALLSAALSPEGYVKIKGIMDADETLRKTSGNNSPPFGLDEFYISFVGAPSTSTPWLFQFGGHHLALNLTYVGENGVMTPTLTAVQPSVFTQDGKTVRPLGAETDKAYALVNALDESQQKQAILGAVMRDLVLGPGQDGKTVQPEGIKASAFTVKQKEMLLDLAREWVGIVPAPASEEKMREIRSNLDETWFAWSGPTDPAKPAYFRIQGPTVWIEFAPQKLGGDAMKHIHTIYRDPTNDYGKKLLHR